MPRLTTVDRALVFMDEERVIVARITALANGRWSVTFQGDGGGEREPTFKDAINRVFTVLSAKDGIVSAHDTIENALEQLGLNFTRFDPLI